MISLSEDLSVTNLLNESRRSSRDWAAAHHNLNFCGVLHGYSMRESEL